MNTRALIHGHSLVHGTARGEVAALSSSLSLWGGLDLDSGRISDNHHPQYGKKIAGKILVMPGGRGSSSSSSILLESARLGMHPQAIIITNRDPIIVMGALVAADLYNIQIPVIQLDIPGMQQLSAAVFADANALACEAVVQILDDE